MTRNFEGIAPARGAKSALGQRAAWDRVQPGAVCSPRAACSPGQRAARDSVQRACSMATGLVGKVSIQGRGPHNNPWLRSVGARLVPTEMEARDAREGNVSAACRMPRSQNLVVAVGWK